ncbi:MutS-related protein [Nocardia spumae]|uniref:MutS-related protein n=1 Tax=Nocardia spumae TaxID=2887190 RepID=UPI001D14374D|nr:DNA mismatch repair protein [Nocardia spumae]
MKAELLDSAPGVRYEAVGNGPAVIDDLGWSVLFDTMAHGDAFIGEVVRALVPQSLVDPAAIRYRQQVLADCCAHPDAVRELYRIATEATEVRRWTAARNREPRTKLNLSLEPLDGMLTCAGQLRAALRRYAPLLRSDGFTRLTTRLDAELNDDYLDAIRTCLRGLRFDNGYHMSAGLGRGNKATEIVLHEPTAPRRRRLALRSGRSFQVPNDDEAGSDYVTALLGRGLRSVADTVSHATDLVQRFFSDLRTELAFYLGGLNLYEAVRAAGYPACFPDPLPSGTPGLEFAGLRDPALCLSSPLPVAGNTLTAPAVSLVVATGANSGGKSTFLRGVGSAHLMMQAGLFVVADSFAADVRDGIFTHFRAPEDATMTYGKLAEEMVRMRGIVDGIGDTSLVLCNEPFSSTNEREAAEIAAPIVRALCARGAKLVLVTHLYDLAHGLYERDRPDAVFLRAERLADGTRTYRLVPGAPETTSHGGDIFGRMLPDRSISR